MRTLVLFCSLSLFLYQNLSSQESTSIKWPKVGKRLSYNTITVHYSHFNNQNTITNDYSLTVYSTRNSAEQLLRYSHYEIYDLPDLREEFPEFKDVSTRVIKNDVLEDQLKSTGLGFISYYNQIHKWFALSISLGQIRYSTKANSEFYGRTNDNDIFMHFDYVQSASAIFNDYLIRLNSPYLFDKILVFGEAGIGIKYTYKSELKEDISFYSVNGSEDPNDSNQTHSYIINSSSTNRSIVKPLNSDGIFKFGLNARISERFQLEGFGMYRFRTPALTMDLNPTTTLATGFSLSYTL